MTKAKISQPQGPSSICSKKLFAQKKAVAAALVKAAPAKTSSAKPTSTHTATAAKGTAATSAKTPITTANTARRLLAPSQPAPGPLPRELAAPRPALGWHQRR